MQADLANTAVQLWQGDAGSLRHVSDSANQVYSFTAAGQQRYLRLTSRRARTKAHIAAELDFIAHLQQGGINAMRPVASAAGQLIAELATVDDVLFACVFEAAAGAQFSYDSAGLSKEHFRLRGRTLGRMHVLAQAYIPAAGVRRYAWDEDELLLAAAAILPAAEQVVWRAYHELRERLRAYPKASQTYGLIHGDFGETNYRWRDNQLNVFDFDDCCYHWFTYDLAVTIYPHGWRKEGLQLWAWLLEGYAENMRADITLAEITMFCQWRLIYMFLVYARKWSFTRLSVQQANWFAQKRANIARGYTWAA